MHAGGWIVNLLQSPRAHNSDPELQETYVMRRAVRNTAPLFMESSMRILLKKSSPMLLIAEPDDKTMFAPWPTREQAQTKIRFYNTVHGAAFSFISCAPRMHAFNFSGDLDDWPHLCGPRRGPALDEHYRCWRTLPAHSGRSEPRQAFPFYSFGVCHRAQLTTLKVLAFAAKPSWTTDETDQTNLALRKTLDAAFQLHDTAANMTETEVEQGYIRFIYSSVFRQAASNLADVMAALVGLQGPCPAHPHCEKHLDNLGHTLEQRRPGLKSCVLASLNGLFPRMPETPRFVDALSPAAVHGSHGKPFEQPIQYSWNAIIVDCLESGRADPDMDTMSKLERTLLDMENVFVQIRDKVPEELLRNPCVAGAGYSLVKELGRKPDSNMLRAGLLTGISTGIGPMPSEIMRVSRATRPARHRDRTAALYGRLSEGGSREQVARPGFGSNTDPAWIASTAKLPSSNASCSLLNCSRLVFPFTDP